MSELLTKCNICLITTKLGPHLYISSNFTDEIVIILNSPYFTSRVLKSGSKKIEITLSTPVLKIALFLTQNDVILLKVTNFQKWWTILGKQTHIFLYQILTSSLMGLGVYVLTTYSKATLASP